MVLLPREGIMAGFWSNLRGNVGAALPWNKSRGSIKYPASTTGFDARELTHSPLEQEVKQRLNAPKLTSRNPEVVGRQYVRSIDDMVHHQPEVHTEELVKHIVKEGAWGFGEAGSRFFADYVTNNPQLKDAVHRALTSQQMVSLAKEHGTRGYLRNTQPRTAVDVLFENQLTAGNHFYDALINDRYRGFEIRSLIRRARQMDAEAARPAEPAPAPQAPQYPGELPEPENGRGYTIHELKELSGLFGGAGHPINISPVFNNNPRNYNAQNSGSGSISQGDNRRRFIGMVGLAHRGNGFRGYDGHFVDEGKPAKKNAGNQRLADAMVKYPVLLSDLNGTKLQTAYEQGKLNGLKNYFAGINGPRYSPVDAELAESRANSKNVGYAWQRFNEWAKDASQRPVYALPGGVRLAALQSGKKPVGLPSKEEQGKFQKQPEVMALNPGKYTVAVNELLSAFGVSRNKGVHEQNIFERVKGKNFPQAKAAVVAYLARPQGNSGKIRNAGKLRYAASKEGSQNSKLVKLIENVHRAANNAEYE